MKKALLVLVLLLSGCQAWLDANRKFLDDVQCHRDGGKECRY